MNAIKTHTATIDIASNCPLSDLNGGGEWSSGVARIIKEDDEWSVLRRENREERESELEKGKNMVKRFRFDGWQQQNTKRGSGITWQKLTVFYIHWKLPSISCGQRQSDRDRVKGQETEWGTQREKWSSQGQFVSVILMKFNERFVPDRGPVCFSTLAEPWTGDRCNFLIIFIELAVT